MKGRREGKLGGEGDLNGFVCSRNFQVWSPFYSMNDEKPLNGLDRFTGDHWAEPWIVEGVSHIRIWESTKRKPQCHKVQKPWDGNHLGCVSGTIKIEGREVAMSWDIGGSKVM